MSDSMEVELLRQMMAERETRIELLKVKLSFYNDKEHQLRLDLEQVKDQRMNESIEQQGERIEWQHTHAETIKQLEQLTRDLHQQMASLQKYVAMVQQQQDKNPTQQQQQQSDSSFVMQMQAQLCKAMHSQGIADHQLKLANQHSDAIVKQLRDALVFVEEERTTVELEFMNELVKEDTETREMETGFKERLAEIHKEISQLEEDLEEKSKGSDDETSDNEENDDEEEEEDEEEMKQAKQEMMNMLHEQKDKIAALEKLNEKQLRQISSLQRRINNPDASTEFFAPSEEMGMSYDESESEGEQSDHAEDPYPTQSALSNGSASHPEEELPAEEQRPVEEQMAKSSLEDGNDDDDKTASSPESDDEGQEDNYVEEAST